MGDLIGSALDYQTTGVDWRHLAELSSKENERLRTERDAHREAARLSLVEIERLKAELASLRALDPVRLEAAASTLVNLDEGLPLDDDFGKRIMSHQNRDAVHDGDCTKRPYTCCRCLYESELKRARETILAYLGKTEGE